MPQPLLCARKLLRLEPNEVIPAGDAPPNEARTLKYGNVLRHRVQREAMPPSELRHTGFRRGRELLQQSAPCSVTERKEELVETTL